MIGTALASLFRVPVAGFPASRMVAVPVIGVMLGSGFQPGLLGEVLPWTVLLGTLPVFIILATMTSYLFYRQVARYDRPTAYFSSLPGGLTEMMLLGVERGGDLRRISLAHATRIVVVIPLSVATFTLFAQPDGPGPERSFVGLDSIPAASFGLLALSAFFGSWMGGRIRLPAAGLIGPMILSGSLYLSGVVQSPPPTLLVATAQLMVGTLVGCRFAGTTFSKVGRDLTYATMASCLMFLVAWLFAIGIGSLTKIGIGQSFLAFSPGGLTEMGFLALSLGQEVALVSVAHLARITLVVFCAALAYRLFLRMVR